MTHREPFGAPFLIVPLFRFNIELASQKQGTSSRHQGFLDAVESNDNQSFTDQRQDRPSVCRKNSCRGTSPSKREVSPPLQLLPQTRCTDSGVMDVFRGPKRKNRLSCAFSGVMDERHKTGVDSCVAELGFCRSGFLEVNLIASNRELWMHQPSITPDLMREGPVFLHGVHSPRKPAARLRRTVAYP